MRPALPVGLTCLLVLSGCSHPPPVAAPPADPPRPATSGKLVVASWNIEWLNRSEGKGEVPRTAADYARLAAYARRLDADIVALQEVDGEGAARRVFDPAVYEFSFTSDETTPQRTGFAWRKSLSGVPRPDVRSLAAAGPRRGADLEIEIAGSRLRLLSIHLKAGCDDRPLQSGDSSCSVLAAQVPALEAWIDGRAREGVPFVVLGDFNRRFGANDELWTAIDDGDPPGADLLDAGPRQLIDHIVLGGGAKAWLAPGSFRQLPYDREDRRSRAKLSDHSPIVVELDPSGTIHDATRSPRVWSTAEAASHVGEHGTVCGVVASARHVEAAGGGPTFLNLDRPHPHQPFTIFIRGRDRNEFERPEVRYLRQRICVTGTIALHDGRPEIVAKERSQIADAK